MPASSGSRHACPCLHRLLLCVVLLLPLPGLAAGVLGGHRIVVDAAEPYYDVGKHARYLEDVHHLLSVEDFITHPADFHWRPGRATTPNFGYTASAYWLHFTLDNLDDPSAWLLEISYPLLDDVQILFVDKDRVVQRIQTGDRRGFAQRPLNHRSFLTKLPNAGVTELDVYIRVVTDGTMEIPVTLYRETAFWEKEQQLLVVKGIYAGLIMVMVLYNFFIYLAVKETSYLYYVCYAFFILAVQFSLDGMAYQFLWPTATAWHEVSFLLCIAFTSTFQSLFTHSFLDLQHRLPTLDKILMVLVLLLVLSAAFSIIGSYAVMVRIVVGLVFPMSLLCWMAGLILFARGVAVARYFLLGWTVFFLGTLAMAASKFGLLPINFFTNHAMQIGSALEVVLFSLALADRINIDKREKLAAKQEAIENLERFKGLYDNAIEGIFQCTLEGRFISANPSMAHFMGYATPEDFINHVTDRGPQVFMDPILYHEFRRAVLNKGQVLNFEAQGRRRDGRPFWFSLSAKMVKAMNQGQSLIEGFVVDITERKRSEDQLHFLARHDPLTGLVNRREFEHRLDIALSEAHREGIRHSVLFMDLDQFKLVNDTCGHIAGDELLRQVTLQIQQQMRSGDTLARMGGDEFGVLLERCSGSNAMHVANKIRTSIQDFRFVWDNKIFTLGVSIGLVAISEQVDSVKALLSLADAACYAAKDAGRNRVHEYDPSDTELASQQNQMQWASRINLALEQNEFLLYIQPIVAVAGREQAPRHFEVLVRLKNEEDMVFPGAFLPAAERYNLMPTLDRWVVRHLFQWMARHPQKIEEWELCSINLSGLTLGDEDFVAFLRHQFETHAIPHHKICFEITETVAVINLANTLRFMEEFKAIGCRFSLDDFGSGFSSYGYLKNLPVDFLKIDGTFVKDIEVDEIDYAMVESINRIGHVMGKKTIGEFVENDRILSLLKTIGVDYAQGYGIAKPIPLNDL